MTENILQPVASGSPVALNMEVFGEIGVGEVLFLPPEKLMGFDEDLTEKWIEILEAK